MYVPLAESMMLQSVVGAVTPEAMVSIPVMSLAFAHSCLRSTSQGGQAHLLRVLLAIMFIHSYFTIVADVHPSSQVGAEQCRHSDLNHVLLAVDLDLCAAEAAFLATQQRITIT